MVVCLYREPWNVPQDMTGQDFQLLNSMLAHLTLFYLSVLLSSVQSLSRVQLFVTPWTEAHQASLSITNSQSLLKLMSIESAMPSNHLIFCRFLLLLPSIFPSIRVFSNESALRIRWPKYWSFSFNISPSNEHSGLISQSGTKIQATIEISPVPFSLLLV